MKRKKVIKKTDDGKLEDLVGRYFQSAEASGTQQSGDFDSEGVFRRIQAGISGSARRIKMQTRMFWAAAAGIVLLLGVLGIMQRRPAGEQVNTAMAERSAGAGETIQVTLPDGSVVWLNAGSTVSYPATFSSDKRAVFIDGEAYLEVQQDPERPFLVHTGKVITTVLGTSFNVAAYAADQQVEVTVLTGKVSLSTTSGSAPGTLLTPGQQAACTADGKLVAFRENIDAAESILWKDHKMIYNGKRLSQVIASLEHWHDVKIIADAPLYGCTISADFTGEPVESVVRVLAQLVNGKAVRDGDTYRITGEGCTD